MIKFILRVLYLPLVVICYIIKWIATLTIKCSCYILSPLLLFLGVCCIATIIRQQWDQTLLLLLLASAGILILFAATLIAALAQCAASSMHSL